MRVLLRLLPLLFLLPLQAEELPSDVPPAAPEPVVEPAPGAETEPVVEPAPDVPTARCRILHAAPRHGALTLFQDGVESVPALAYGSLSPYQPVSAGVHGFGVSEGEARVAMEQDATFEAGSDYTIAITAGQDGLRLLQIRDHQPLLPGDEAGRVRATNLVAGRSFTFSIEDRQLAALLRPGQSTPPIAAVFGERTYRFEDTTPGGANLSVGPASVPERTTYSFYLIGLPGAEDEAAVRVIEDLSDWPADEAPWPVPVPTVTHPKVTRVRVLHLAGGTGALGGTFDGKPLFTNLAFGDVTPYLPQAPGAHELKLSGGPQYDQEPVVLRESEAHTLVLCGEPERLRWWLLFDGHADEAVARPAVRVAHAAWPAPSVIVSPLDCEPLADPIDYFGSTEYVSVAAHVAGQRLELAVRPAGQSTVVRAARVLVEPDGLYTLYLADSGTEDARAVRLKLVKDGGP